MSRIYLVIMKLDNCAEDKEDFYEYSAPVAAFWNWDRANEFIKSDDAIAAVQKSTFYHSYVLGDKDRSVIVTRLKNESCRIMFYGGYYNQIKAYFYIQGVEVTE